MKLQNLVVFGILSTLFYAGCSSPVAEKQATIKSMEDTLFSDQNKMIDKKQANDLIAAYIGFANEFPDVKTTPEYLFKAGDMAMNLNMPQKAIEVFDRILKNYPDFVKAPQCLFLKGYVYENSLGDLENAKKFYEEFIEKYPNDDFADDAKMSLKNLGKSPEELIREFEEQEKLKDSI